MEAAGVADWRAEGLMDAERLAGEPELRAELDRRTTELFKTRTAEEWELLIAEAGSEATVCRTTAEWIEHPHALESEMVIEVEDPHIGVTKQPGINARLSETPGEVRGPAPVLDAQRDAILASLANGDGAAGGAPRRGDACRPRWRQGAGPLRRAGRAHLRDGPWLSTGRT